MIIVLKPEATLEATEQILARISDAGLKPLHMPGSERVVLGALGDERVLAELHLESHPLVESVKPILAPYKLVSREVHPHDTIVRIGKLAIGGSSFKVIAGPCAVETREQLSNTATAVKAAGASGIRAGAYKPRTSPYGFSGHGVEALKILREVGDELDLPIITEVMDTADLDIVAEYADALQIGARNMHNFSLLRAVGKSGKPVVLKRGHFGEDRGASARGGISAGGRQRPGGPVRARNPTYETATRNTLDLNAVPYMKQRTHLPVIVDPSHGTGIRDLVIPMSLAGRRMRRGRASGRGA
jgi:3-deoxy-7-phosphoheptulonate synthase